MSPRPQFEPNRKIIEAKLSEELKSAREAYGICTERYKRLVGVRDEILSAKTDPSDFLTTATMKAHFYATERYRRALDAYNRFLLEGKLPGASWNA
jgi:hypothetical protein